MRRKTLLEDGFWRSGVPMKSVDPYTMTFRLLCGWKA